MKRTAKKTPRKRYRMLMHGEIIQRGDQVKNSYLDGRLRRWYPVYVTVGQALDVTSVGSFRREVKGRK